MLCCLEEIKIRLEGGGGFLLLCLRFSTNPSSSAVCNIWMIRLLLAVTLLIYLPDEVFISLFRVSKYMARDIIYGSANPSFYTGWPTSVSMEDISKSVTDRKK